MSSDPVRGRDSRGVPVSRRSVLASVGLLGSGALAGCLSGGGEKTTLDLREPDGQRLGIATLETDLRDDQIELLRDATTDEAATAYGYEPFADVRYARLDRTYYRIRTEATGTATVEKPVLVVTPTDEGVDAVPLTSYDGHVVELVDPLTGDADPQTLVLSPDVRGVDALYPEPRHEYVTWEDATYRLAVEDRRVEQEGRRVRATAVATTPAEFEAHLREEAIDEPLAPSEFSQEARDIFRAAIDDEYQEEAPYSDAFETVLDAVESGLAADAARTGIWLVVYDETLYRAEVRTVAWD